MAFYEHVFIVRPDLTEAQVKTMTGDFAKILKKGGGKLAKEEYWGLRTLAYQIKKNKKAHYVMFNIDGPHPAIAEMERHQRLDDNVLRIMTIRVDELEEGPSVMMRAKPSDDYDDRRPRRFDHKRDDRGGHKRDDREAHKRDDRAENKPDDKESGKKGEEK